MDGDYSSRVGCCDGHEYYDHHSLPAWICEQNRSFDQWNPNYVTHDEENGNLGRGAFVTISIVTRFFQ